MKDKDIARALLLAIDMAGQVAESVPGIAREDMVPALWPLALHLTTMRRRARKDAKAARKYRQLRAEVAAVIRAAEPDSFVAIPSLMRSVAFDPACWRTALVPGCQVTALEAA